LPNEIVWRKDKTGFEPPQRQWMQDRQVQEAIQQAKEVLVTNDILDASVLKKKNQPHDAHVADNRVWKYWSASYLFKNPDL
jgi:asparagine synthase (glutamine-hydrolysing)